MNRRMRASLSLAVLVSLVCCPALGRPEAGPSFVVTMVLGGNGWIGREQHVPADIVVDEADGHFYVTQLRNSYVKKFRLDGPTPAVAGASARPGGTFVDTFGESRAWNGTFASPYGIALGPDGNLYLALDSPCRIFVMTKKGEKVKTIFQKGGGDGELNRPKDIACSPKNGLLYVVDRYNFRIQYFDTEGKVKGKWGSRGAGPGQFYLARGIAIDKSGSVYVADTFNHRVQVFTGKGKFIRSFGKRGSGNGEFKYPSGIAISSEGSVFVTDAGNGRIVWFTKEGKPLGAFGRRGTKPGEFNQPLGITVDSKGRLYVADTMNHRVQVLTPRRGPEAKQPLSVSEVTAIPVADIAPPVQANPVRLTIDAVAQKVSGYPVQLGVPFLPGEMDKANVAVLRNGKVIPSSATEMVRWGGKCSGVKFALVRFQADLDTKPTTAYSVVFGAKIPEKIVTSPPLRVRKAANGAVVDTGTMSFRVSANPLVLFRDVRVGGKPLVATSVLEVVRADGKRFSKLTGGKVEIEHQDNLGALIKVTGSFDHPDAGGLGIIARITAYAGKPYVKLSYTLIQNAAEPVLELSGWKLRLVPAARFSSYEIGGEEKNYTGKLDRPVELFQDGELTPKDGSLRVVATRMRYTGVGTGKRAPGWAKVSSPDGTVLAAVRHFWQQYPKSIEIKPDALDLWLQSPKSKTTFKPLVAGWAKTHEILLHFSAEAEAQSGAVREAFQQGVRVSVPPERYRKSGVFGAWSLPNPASRDHDFVATTFLDYTRYPHIVHFAFQGSGRWWMEGNLNFGSRMIWNFYLNNTRDSAGRLFMHSLRLLENYPNHSRYAFDLAEIQARCSMDLHVMHCDNKGNDFAGWGPGMIYAHSSYPRAGRMLRKYPAHRRYTYYNEPFDPRRAGSRWGPMIHPAGLMEYYLLTGEPRAREVLTEIGDWAVAFQKKGDHSYTRYVQACDGPGGLYFWTLMSAYEATGRKEYLDALYAAVPELGKAYERYKGSFVGRRKDSHGRGVLLTCLIRLMDFDKRFGRLDRREMTKWIVDTVKVFHPLVRRRERGPGGLSLRCSGRNRMMYHAFGWVAALPDAPDWAREDFRSFMGTPAYHTTHPDEERFEYIRPGSHDGIITVCSTIEEGTEMWLWASAETIALYEKVFGKAGLPSPDDPMNAYYAEYGRACREDPKSLVALEPEVPDPDQMGGFTRIPVCKVPFTGKPPAVDGDADDPCWTQAVSITDFTLESNSGPSQLKTTVKLAWDRENLYVLMLAPDLKPPKRVRGRDGGQWQEDGIELFLDTNFDRTSYWQIVLNLTGESGDACYVQPLLSVDDWNPDFRFGRKPGVIEIAIPFKAFDCKWDVEGPVVPKRWSANFCRTGDGSSWVGYNMALIAHIPQGFGVLEFLPAREAGGD